MSTSHASKQLHAIREQLKELEHQYRVQNKPNTARDTVTKTIHLTHFGVEDETRAVEEAASSMGQDSKSPNTTDVQAPVLEESSVILSNDFEHMECVLSTLIADPAQEPLDSTLPEELRHAIINMEENDYVNTLIDDVISSVPGDSTSDQDLQAQVQYVSCPTSEEYEGGKLCQSSGMKSSVPEVFKSQDEVDLRRKDRIKKDNHNIIERRRRYNINDRIKEISSLLPPSTHPSMKLNKGSILQAAVDYIKDLKKDKEKLEESDAKLKTMNSKYQRLQIKTLQLELKLKLYGLTEGLLSMHAKKKKRERTKYSEINGLVEELVKHSTPSKLKTIGCSTYPSHNGEANYQESCTKKTTKSPATNSILRGLMMKRISTESHQRHTNHQENVNHLKLQSEEHRKKETSQYQIQHQNGRSESVADEIFASKTEEEMISLHHNSHTPDLSLEQCNVLLDLFGNNSTPNITVVEMDNEPSMPLHCPEQVSDTVTSPLTATTNMLEALLKRSNKVSLSTDSVESSLDSII